MTDIVDSATRSRNMSKIKSKDTKPELLVRRYLHSKGFRYKLHDKNVPGSPDLVLPKYRAVVFVHGCFWHRHENCRLAYQPKTRIDFWQKKFADNIERDSRVKEQLSRTGWRTLVIWECATRSPDWSLFLDEASAWISGDSGYKEIPF